MRRVILSSLILFSVALATNDCGKSSNSVNGSLEPGSVAPVQQDQDIQFNLEPVIVQNPVQTEAANPLTVVPRGFTRNPKSGQVSLRADIDDEKDLEFLGTLPAGSQETHLHSSDKDTEAVVACADEELCDQMVVTITKKNKEGTESHQQFITPKQGVPEGTEEDDEGLGPSEETPIPKKESKNSLSQALGPHSAYRNKKTGTWTFGALSNGIPFPKSGPGFVLRENEEGMWTTFTMVSLITHAAAQMQLQKRFASRPPLEIGDIAKKGGGFYPGHISHENGLDIDIAYPAKVQRVDKKWENMSVGTDVNPDFDVERFWFISKKLVELADVPFIFVTPAIKLAICKYVKDNNDYSEIPSSSSFKALLAMRPPYANGAKSEDHRNHFHVREQCPARGQGCQWAKVPNPNEGTGCALPI